MNIILVVFIGVFLFLCVMLWNYISKHTYMDMYLLPKVLDHDEPTNPVDIVITWVDSSDKAWQSSKKHYYIDKNTDNNTIRFPDIKYPDLELETTILLILKNIKWHGTIYIVTADGQIPNCYNKFKNVIQIVHHSQIWPRDMIYTLPTFNSHAIECNIHRIKNLSNNFIYFNDDMYVIKNLEYNTMFYKNKMVVQPVETSPPSSEKSVWHIVWRNMYNMYNMYSPKHYCYSLTRNAMYSAEQSIPYHWKTTMMNRFRTNKDVAPVGYTINFATRNNMGYFSRNPLKLLGYHKPDKTFEYPQNTDVDVICINETSDIFKSVSSLRANCL